MCGQHGGEITELKVIASAARSQPTIINVKGTNFGNRLVTSGKLYDGKDFNVRIVPVVFQDAGIYTCFLESIPFPTIDLITVKVTAEPSDAVTEGDNVTLTCSVSHDTGSMRLVWINGDGKRVGEKTLTEEEKSLSLVIQKAGRGRGNWRCVLFDQDLPRLFVPNYQKDSSK
ncbi:CD276 antigen homolog [Amblyraja radiata]|uniref:CD276 antigen homolog n=1 Tax=Amblyraja radiata TaxID=386614 RepID=UPI0014024546|nr:CD276 antigen homolog [Amblyraja radiata]